MLENELNRPKHLLIMRLSAIGDVAMIVPIVLALRQQYPDLKITVVSRPLFKSFFSILPGINFYAADVENSQTGIAGLYALFKDLSLLEIDAFADLHNVLRSKVIATFFKWNKVSVVSINKDRLGRKKLTALKPKHISPMKSMFERHATVCASLNLPISLPDVILPDKQKLSTEVEQLSGLKNSKWLGIAPFAAYETKMYPLHLMKEVIQLLLQEQYKVFLFGGGQKEIELLNSLAAVSKNCINVAGKLTFDKELELISNLDLMLSMDSGNGHMAAIFGIPVITMWGNTHPYAGFTPFGQALENSLLPDLKKYPFLPTSVYGNKMINGYTDCMKTIQPEVVADKINHMLTR